MEREYTRQEFYDLVWSQPMQKLAQSFGISDVALAKQCKKANIPVPNRGYWARKQAGKSVIQVALPPRLPGASDRFNGADYRYGFYGSDWAEKYKDVPIPPEPTFDEELASVEERARKLVGKVRCPRTFEPAHPLVAKLLGHDEIRRQERAKWGWSDGPLYEASTERRRLLIINALFVAAARLGCRPSISTSKYGQSAGSERPISITVGSRHNDFTLEPIKSNKEGKKERLRLAFGEPRSRAPATKYWEDSDTHTLEDQLTDAMVEMLMQAERSYRNGLVHHREWIIERKAVAEKELLRRKEETECKERELQERLAGERIAGLLSQAKALDRANQIRAYVDAVLTRSAELSGDMTAWAGWARQEADRIDPVKNGTIAKAIEELSVSLKG